MNIKYTIALVASVLAFSAQAEYSQSADDYAKARYGTTTPDKIYDTEVTHTKSSQHQEVNVGQPPADHDVHRFESFMGDHD